MSNNIEFKNRINKPKNKTAVDPTVNVKSAYQIYTGLKESWSYTTEDIGPEIDDSHNSTDKLVNDPNISSSVSLRILRDTWQMMSNEGFHKLLEKIQYPRPYPDIKNVIRITYDQNILEIFEGDRTDEDNIPGHRVYESRPKKSYPAIDNGEKRKRGDRYHVPKIRGSRRTIGRIEESKDSGS